MLQKLCLFNSNEKNNELPFVFVCTVYCLIAVMNIRFDLFDVCVCVCACARECVCASVCACVRSHEWCVCVRACVRKCANVCV